MSAKAYVLLNVVHEKQQQVVRALRGKPGVLMVDVVEGEQFDGGNGVGKQN
jgi:hypothetical protein